MGAVDWVVHRSAAPRPTPVPTASPSATVVAAIPARYGSTRLPAKPLAPIAGRPLIEHVYERAAAAPAVDRVVVLTDDERIGRAVDAFGGHWELTPGDCPSGTDRIAWAARGWDCAAVVNVQGDWILDPGLIGTLARHLATRPEDPMATLAVPAGPGDAEEPSVVKVVCDLEGRALYFSRAAIPYRRQPGGPAALRHLGIYGYRRETLLHLASLPPTPLEKAESLEQLRALEHGVPIRVLVVEGDALGVDTPEDLARAEAALTT